MSVITLDASALQPDGFALFTHDAQAVPGPDGQTVQHGATLPTYDLQPGTYVIGHGNSFGGFTFTVGSSGTVDFDPSHDVFLSGRGTSTLTVRGFAVTIDTTALDVRLLGRWGWFSNVAWLEPGAVTSFVLAPCTTFTFQTTYGGVSLSFSLGIDGAVLIDPQYTGFASWDATSRVLCIQGYTVQIDARRLSSHVCLLQGNRVGLLSRGQVQSLTLVPSESYVLQSNSGGYADWFLELRTDGTWDYASDCDGFLEGRASQTMVLWGYPVVIDGRRAGCTSISICPDEGGRSSDGTAARLLAVLLPLTYTVTVQGGISGSANLTLTRDGSVAIDATAAGLLSQGTVKSAVVHAG